MTEQLIQSQQVTLTGPVEQIPELLKELELRAWYRKCTVTFTPTSVPDATVGVTEDSQQNPRQCEPCPFCGSEPLMRWYEYSSGREFAVECQNDSCLGASFQDADPEKALAQWNRRVPDAQGSVTEQSQQKSRQDGE